jgi:membrane protein DedA with SNARE-associated domain
MSSGLIIYITKYGYYGIFILVFLQEIGVPNPIPNELVLLFSGYLSFTGILKLPFVILAALSADFIGTCMLHTVFYFFGAYILLHKPPWLPIPVKSIQKLTKRLSRKGLMGIYIGRLTPFIRGYTSVISGLLQMKHRVFLPIAVITATIWSAAYATTGMLMGPFWHHFISNMENFKYIMLLMVIIIFLLFLLFSCRRFVAAKVEGAKQFQAK